MSVPSASFGWSCTAKHGETIRVELSANDRDQVVFAIEYGHLMLARRSRHSTAFLTRVQASALGAAIQLALLAVPETEDDIDGVHDQGNTGR